MPKIEDLEDIFILPPLTKPTPQQAALQDFFVTPASLPLIQAKEPLEDIFVAAPDIQEQTPLEELLDPKQTLKVPQIFNTLSSAAVRDKIEHDFTFSVYPLCKFSELLEFVNTKNLNKTTFRFVIDTDYNLWFAPEGSADNTTIPAHFQLTGKTREEARCLAAGTITLDAEQRRLIEISNKSGDFTPHFNCLRHLLNILLINKDLLTFALPQQLSILRLQNKTRENIYKVELSDLMDFVKYSNDSGSQRILKDQPQEIVTHTYKTEQQASRFQSEFFAHKVSHESEAPSGKLLSSTSHFRA